MSQPISAQRRRLGQWMQVAWLACAILAIGLALAGVRYYFDELQLICDTPRCAHMQATTEMVADYIQIGEKLGAAEFRAHALTTIAHQIVIALFVLALSGLLISQKPQQFIVVLTAFTFLLLALTLSQLPQALARANPAYEGLIRFIRFLLLTGLLLVFSTLPDGKFHQRWLGGLVALFSTICFVFVVIAGRGLEMPVAEDNAVFAGITAFTALIVLTTLFQRFFNAIQVIVRQQLKWVLVGLSFILSWVFVSHIFYLIAPGFMRGYWFGFFNTLNLVVTMSFVGCITVAVLQFQLFDIDVVINRGLVYGILTVFVVAVYAFIVSGLSVAFANLAPAEDAAVRTILPFIATALVAIIFQPARERLQRWVNRLMYGERDEPYAVLARLGQRLEATLAPQAVLPTLAETVAHALRLPFTAIQLTDGTTATYGVLAAGTPLETFPLVHQKETIGQLEVAPRTATEVFSPAERRLLADIAHQAGVAAYAVRLTAELQRSRERLVTAREEERRRLRRDLHDGIGPQLAALNLQAGAVRQFIRANPAEAERLTGDMRVDIHEAIANIRRVVYDLRPPALDELGLVGAVRGHAEQLASALPIRLHAPPDGLPPLPAAVEVAAYRIIQEALTNVVKHAQAQNCSVTICLAQALRLEVEDNGIGLPAGRRMGIGLNSMRERAEELGGTCIIAPRVPQGTIVKVTLPIPNP